MTDWESHSLFCDTCVVGVDAAVGVAGGIFGDGEAELAPMVAWICVVEFLNDASRFCAEDFLRMPGRLVSTTLYRFMIAVRVDRGQLAASTSTSTITMADINSIAKQFTDFYYSSFDSNRATLLPLYVSDKRETYSHLGSDRSFPGYQRPQSMLTWEGSPILGDKAIVEKITVSCPRNSAFVQRTDV